MEEEEFYLHIEQRRMIRPKDENVTITQRVNSLMEDLPNIESQAKENIEKSQEKQKKYHDKKYKTKKNFQIRNKSGKLEEKWKGSYYIHEIISKGSYKIKTMEGRIQKMTINGELLKEYINRSSFEVIIRI
ncbi:DDE-type integrase/transposase/recombinase [Rhizophagus irregularis DAOM 181602=DAOM 197198]|nr:DDE-type integrase/transposase/recombinase [Rhizophagus irregularis DAOM 181602=DAOM 197198]